jgi:protein-disulfide isomerase
MNKIVAGFFVCALIAGSTEQKSAAGKAQGFPTAPVRIEVFSDFECPHCKLLYEDTLRPLMREYVASGKVYLIHRDFPLPNHAHAREAACYANASARVNKYEEVCSALFSRQASWSVSGNVEEALASVLSPPELSKVRALAKDPKIAAEIDQDVALGQKARITQTPTMEITHNGRITPVSGSVSYAILSRYLNDLLSK